MYLLIQPGGNAMSYKHISIEERACIKKLVNEGTSLRKIAKVLDRSPSTISREIRRNKGGNNVYHPLTASRLYSQRRLNCGRRIQIDCDVVEYINLKINQNWSPEQVDKRSKKENNHSIPSFSTIYRWIHSGLIVKGDMKKLRRKGKFKRPQETRGRFNIGKTIKKRPKHVHKREELGHWEADTVESGRYGHKHKSSFCLVTLVERKSRYTLSCVLPNRKESNVTTAIIKMLSSLDSELVKTITCDRGKEFSGYEQIEKALKCDVYFADPYCSWQRGTNENTNGLLREYYPKGSDLAKVSHDDLKEKITLLNSRPRKCIQFQTPHEVLFDKCCT